MNKVIIIIPSSPTGTAGSFIGESSATDAPLKTSLSGVNSHTLSPSAIRQNNQGVKEKNPLFSTTEALPTPVLVERLVEGYDAQAPLDNIIIS